MPDLYPWKEVKAGENPSEIQHIIDILAIRFTSRSYKSCSLCSRRSHKMRIKYGNCTDEQCNKESDCPVQYRHRQCEKHSSKVTLETVFKHNCSQLNHIDFKHPVRTDQVRKQKYIFSMTELVKSKIEDLVTEGGVTKPSEVRLLLLRDSDIDRASMPSLKQLQNYLCYRRKKILNQKRLNSRKKLKLKSYLQNVNENERKFGRQILQKLYATSIISAFRRVKSILRSAFNSISPLWK